MKLIKRLNPWASLHASTRKQGSNSSLLASLLTMAWMVEARDPYTGGHLWRVSQYCGLLAEEAGFASTETHLIALGGFVHDLGKVAIPDSILCKPGPLSDAEYKVIKTHPEIGKRLLESHPLSSLVMAAVWSHHETPDGRGYPRGLAAGEIPKIAAVVGICDAFDAMTSHRPYRDGMAPARALELIRNGSGKQFDSTLADLFIHLGNAGRLDDVLGHTDVGMPLGRCWGCGPIIVVKKRSRAGEQVFCPACGMGYTLYRSVDGRLATEPTGVKGWAEVLGPSPDTELINRLADEFRDCIDAHN